MNRFEYKGILDINSIDNQISIENDVEYALSYQDNASETFPEIVKGCELKNKLHELDCAGVMGTVIKLNSVKTN